MIWAAFVLAVAHADPAGCTRAALGAHIEAAEVAFTRLDRWRFTAAADRATKSLICLEEPITPELSGRFHRLRAIVAYMEDDHLTGSRAIRSMRAQLHEGAWPQELVGPDHALRSWGSEDGPADAWREIPSPTSGRILVDGKPESLVPQHRPFVFQWLAEVETEAPETVRLTRYVDNDRLLPGEPWPKERRRAWPRKVLVGTGVTMGFVGGSLLVGSAASASSANRAYREGDYTRAKALETENHRLFLSGLAIAGLGVTFFGVSFTV